ncbi:MAG: PAS domain-containing protein, partial [Deltaproteobacteria bacterium]|nr:PAS domain-containing protein [Deltaproteobacteria bacterium]
MKVEKKVIALSIAFGLFIWVVDAVLDFYFFYEGTFWELLIYDVPKHEVYIRLVILASFIIFGIIVASIMAKRKKVEEALRESEARLAESNQLLAGVLEHTHMMAVYLDPRFNFIWVNRAYADTCRHKPSFFPGKNHFDLYPHEETQAIFQRVVDTGEPFFVAAKPFQFPDQPERGVTYWDWSL